MNDSVRVMLEVGKKKVVAAAFDWPGWDRSGKSEDGAVEVLETYRPRYARVAALAGLGHEFGETGRLTVVERLEGTDTTDFHGVSARSAASEREQMSTVECERKVALLRACWAYFDEVASLVSADLRKGPRGGGRSRDRIVQHTNGAEIYEFARKVGVTTLLDAWQAPDTLRAHRDSFCKAIREYNARGASARTWNVQFLIRRCAYHMLDHAWEMEDRDVPGGSQVDHG